MERVKTDICYLSTKQANFEHELNLIKDDVADNGRRLTDLDFLLDKQEQYSRKTSIRIFDVKEEESENCEELCINVLKEEIGVEVKPEEIEIVHRVGRVQKDKTRAILVKFLSHKTKVRVMRKKKEAKNINIKEDLAQGMKKLVNYIYDRKYFLRVEKVWTIDGKIKFKMLGNPSVHEIRTYTDFDNLTNKITPH